MVPDMCRAIPAKFALRTMVLYDTMLPGMCRAIPSKFTLQTMVLYETMLPDMCRAIPAKFTLQTMVLYDTMLPDMCRAIPVKSVSTSSYLLQLSLYVIRVIFRLIVISLLNSLFVVIEWNFRSRLQIILTWSLQSSGIWLNVFGITYRRFDRACCFYLQKAQEKIIALWN